jgi:hypothetical protein
MESILQRLLSTIRRILTSWPLYFLSAKTEIASPHSPTEQTHSEPGLHGEALVLARQIDGKNFHLPDLRKVFEGWPMATNPHEKRLEVLVDQLLERIITDQRKLKALKQANFAQLISL